MTNNYKLILLIYTILLIFGISVVFIFDVNCIFKSIFHISCPGCGLTRAFRQIFQGNLLQGLKYNILSIPILIFLIISAILLIIDFIKKRTYIENYLKIFKNKYSLVIIIVLLIISFIINNLNQI